MVGGGEEQEQRRKCLRREMGVDRCGGEVGGLSWGGRHPLYGAVPMGFGEYVASTPLFDHVRI